ncbi:YqiA/YcfP family alpha/beta fold hydrolase [Wenyingzhuangia marina]|uniref:Pimeloyl-ACP methyl ester carboxylesterase n=1 Tax=Wenyingzhuangia marina TaxID=1195760 RepID=A0A1M5W748_9FLAO|nr:alpha/beta hydrolase [Wenyingzhuangia marina]GGF75383.1 alpha/beta hydrolase [Wenyingzhuangia marina]SHH83300.1 Pimeloyl-ACP methyl ester carboxylesterase [Wenyingzhuangia marina]
MKTENITHVYFLPGMSACSAIFERIQLPKEKYKMHFLEWIMPHSKKESLTDYTKRFAKQITEKNPVLVGVSFGGVLAQEIAQIIPAKKIILISSVKSPEEYSPFFKTVKATKIHKLLPISFINWSENLLHKNGSKKVRNTLSVYRKFLPLRNKLYTQWAVRSFLYWKGCNNHVDLFHLHGDADKIIPIHYIKNCEIIKNGTHVMILTKSSTIQQHILRCLA